MADKALFSVIIPTYKQENTICDSIGSVLVQDYDNIELIVTDDASPRFDKSGVQEYIERNKKGNLKKYLILTREENVGTVRSLNTAMKEAKGTYTTIFAGDDCLYDEHTLSNYAKAFEEHRDKNIITAQCYRYDSEMKELLLKQVHLDRAHKINEAPASLQFHMLSESNSFAMGATAFRTKILEIYGFFDERYKLIEDWSLFLKLTRNGERFYFVDFVALKHRYGGLSLRKSKDNVYALNSKDFCLDILAVFENEIFPYMGGLSWKQKKQRIDRYMSFITANQDLLVSTLYSSMFNVKLKFLLRQPATALKLFLENRRKN